MGDEVIRAAAANNSVPEFARTPFVAPLSLDAARVAIVTTGALHTASQAAIRGGDQSFRVLASDDELFFGHGSANFDRSGWLVDPNVVFPIDRLGELAAEGRIGSVASHHLSFAGNQRGTLSTIKLDTGPAAADVLRGDGVDVVLLTGV
jgi:D-proline reductase (dithiol) PrdB